MLQSGIVAAGLAWPDFGDFGNGWKDERCGGQPFCLPAERLPAPERTANDQSYRYQA